MSISYPVPVCINSFKDRFLTPVDKGKDEKNQRKNPEMSIPERETRIIRIKITDVNMEDNDILRQIKNAYDLSTKRKHMDKFLSYTFQKAQASGIGHGRCWSYFSYTNAQNTIFYLPKEFTTMLYI